MGRAAIADSTGSETPEDAGLSQLLSTIELAAIETRSALLERLSLQARRTWWATRQSLSEDVPSEAAAFEALCSDMVTRLPGEELELLSDVRRVIAEEATDSHGRAERRNAVIDAAINDRGSRNVLVIVRSEAAADGLQTALARSLGIDIAELKALGIHVVTVFSPWPQTAFDTSIAAGYFGTNTIDMLFASRAAKRKLVLDPIEARVAVWDSERRFQAVSELPLGALESLRSLTEKLEPHASPSSDPVSLSSLFQDGRTADRPSTNRDFSEKSLHVCLCFADGSTRQVPANARFEVLGRRRLQLQSVAAKDLGVGDQVVLLHDDERAAFSDKLLRLLDQTKFQHGRTTRSSWLNIVRLVRAQNAIGPQAIRKRLEEVGFSVHLATVNLASIRCGRRMWDTRHAACLPGFRCDAGYRST